MNIELTILISVISICCTLLATGRNAKKDVEEHTKEETLLMAKLNSIESGVNDIKKELTSVKTEVKDHEKRLNKIETLMEIKGFKVD